MTTRRDTSADSAARFLALRRGHPVLRRPRVPSGDVLAAERLLRWMAAVDLLARTAPPERVVMDFAEPTLRLIHEVLVERGGAAVIAKLVRWGAAPLNDNEDPLAWLQLWRARLTRPMRHPGNFRYLWCLDRRRRREVLGRHAAVAYPKWEARAA